MKTTIEELLSAIIDIHAAQDDAGKKDMEDFLKFMIELWTEKGDEEITCDG